MMLKLKKPIDKVKYLNDREANVSNHINIIGHYDNTTLIDKDGRLIKVFKVEGIDYVTKHQIDLDVFKRRRNNLLKSFNSNYALYSWVIRTQTASYPTGVFKEQFAIDVNAKYKERIDKLKLFHNSIYLALITKAPEGKINRLSYWVSSLTHKANKQAKDAYLNKIYQELTHITKKMLSALSEYQITELGIKNTHVISESIKITKVNITNDRGNNDNVISEPLSFIDYLINNDHFAVPLQLQDASYNLPRKRLFFNSRSGTIELRSANGQKKYAAILSIKNYLNHTYAGILDKIQKLPHQFIITQSFRFFDTLTSKTTVKNQQMDFSQAKDESYSQTAQLNESLDDAASGEAGFGIHHLTVLCLSHNQDELNIAIGNIIAEFSKINIVCTREDVACEASYWAQLPGNFAYILRQAHISSKNMAGFMSLHNDSIGKATGNFWGDAVTILETLSGSPYYFNFHYKDVGNCLCFGTMGSGKTTLIGFLLVQSLKFGGKRIVFDKDRGLYILVRSLGGTYQILKPGIATGFNPCQLEDTVENRAFLRELFKKILTVHGQSFDENDAQIVNKVIIRLYTLPKNYRRFEHIAPIFGAKLKGSLRTRFDEWHGQGGKAWAFDNEIDELNLNHNILGFELGSILDDLECKTPVIMYLMHRVTQAIEGERGGIFIDEGWRVLEDDYFKKIINDLSRTPRKKNNFLCLATQAAEDAANTNISKTLNEAAACKIFFPNPQANKTTYMDNFGLSMREYELVKTMDNDGHYFLLNFAKGKESVVLRANLEGLEDEIAIISGRENTVKLLDQIRQEVGDDPSVWLPIFHQRRKQL